MQKYFILTLGTTFLLWLFFTLIFSVAAEWMGFSINRWSVVAGYVAAMGVVTAMHKRRDGVDVSFIGKLLFFTLGIATLSFLLGGYAYDYAYDGMSYHQPIIRSLMQGWNPLYEPHCQFTAEWECSPYVDHYPKAVETLCAAFASLVGNIECGKAVNLILITSSFCFAVTFLDAYFAQRCGKTLKVLLALLLTLSPVTLSQALTFYVDFTLYAYLLIGVAGLYLYLHPLSLPTSSWPVISPRWFSLIVAVLVSLAVGTKVIAAFWVVVFFLVALLVLWFRKRMCEVRNIVSGMFLGGLIGLFVFSYHPYITHLQQGLHMLHPFMGSEAVNIEGLYPEVLTDCNRVEAVAKSLLSRPGDGSLENEVGYLPCAQNIIASGKADTRLGGGGVLFLEMLLLTPILLLLSWREASVETRRCMLIIAGLITALFVLPNGWWIRFTPFTYAIPLCALLHYLKYAPQKRRVMVWPLLAVAFANILIVGSVSLSLMQMHRSKVNYLTDVLKQSNPVRICTENHTFVHQMQERGIEIYRVDTASQQLIFPGPSVFCYPEEWQTQGLSITGYPLLKYSNIKQGFVFPQ